MDRALHLVGKASLEAAGGSESSEGENGGKVSPTVRIERRSPEVAT